MILGVLFDNQRDLKLPEKLPDVTLLIAAWNEQEGIEETLKYLNNQNYLGNLYVLIIDNNSTDRTKEKILNSVDLYPNLNIQYLFEPKPGKFNALNRALPQVTTEYVITIDADTILYTNALNILVNRMVYESRNKKVGAIAGGVFVRNSRVNILTKLQEWDYFLSIAGVKRSQGLFQSTLVAQGAFSIYNTDALKEHGGWDDSIGEDILVTWGLLADGWKCYYEPLAIAFTNVPVDFKTFRRQRSRWARGMVDGLKKYKIKNYPSLESKCLILFDYFLFIIDFCITFVMIPGLIAALIFHNFLIVGLVTLFTLPLTVIMFSVLYFKEKNYVFDKLGLKVRNHKGSFILFILTYQFIMSPISLIGYFQEIFKIKRKWK